MLGRADRRDPLHAGVSRRATRLTRAGLVSGASSSASPATPTPTSRTGRWGSKRSSSSRAVATTVLRVAGVTERVLRAGVGLEGPQPDLQRDRAASALVRGEALAHRARQALDRLVQHLAVGDVLGKGRLAALGLADPLHRSAASLPTPLARARRPRPWFGPKARSEGLLVGRRPAPPPSRTPMPCSRSKVRAPTPGSSEAGCRRPPASQLSWSRTKKPSGLSRSEAIFAISLLGARPIEQTSQVASLIRRLISWARDWGTGEPGEVDVGLVEAHDLDLVAELAQRLHHLDRAAPVELHVDREDGEVAGSGGGR